MKITIEYNNFNINILVRPDESYFIFSDTDIDSIHTREITNIVSEASRYLEEIKRCRIHADNKNEFYLHENPPEFEMDLMDYE